MSKSLRVKEVTDIILEWVKKKAEDKEIVLDSPFCEYYTNHNTVRYWTKETTGLIPDNSEGKPTGFKNLHHYAFEIECKQEVLHFIFSFSYKNISDDTMEICEEIIQKYRMYRQADPKNPTGKFRRVCDFTIDIKKCQTKDEIMKEMDKYYYQMKGYETFILYKMIDEKEKKNNTAEQK